MTTQRTGEDGDIAVFDCGWALYSPHSRPALPGAVHKSDGPFRLGGSESGGAERDQGNPNMNRSNFDGRAGTMTDHASSYCDLCACVSGGTMGLFPVVSDRERTRFASQPGRRRLPWNAGGQAGQ